MMPVPVGQAAAAHRSLSGRGQQPSRVLMIAYHFPPLMGSSGIQRTLRFVKHLPTEGWDPLVLTAHPRAYERVTSDLITEIPRETVVRRAFALDAARHLALGGRYLGATARPDRWASWQYDAVRQGLLMIEQYRPLAIWSTYPIATAHLIGAELQRRSGLPWIADFRDPMAQDGYPADPKTWRRYQAIEASAMSQALACTFTTRGAAQVYRQRYPDAASRISVIENGYDEESFPSAGTVAAAPKRRPTPQPIVLLHSGIIYPSERDPICLFQALRWLLDQGHLERGALILRFRAAVHDELLRDLAQRHGVADCVETVPALPYRDALAEMMGADALLVLQASNCNEQIPAKLYEYLRAGPPVVGLTDPAGDTAELLARAGIPYVAPLDDPLAIARTLAALCSALRKGDAVLPLPAAVTSASRRLRARSLADLLTSVVKSPGSSNTPIDQDRC